MPILKGLTKTVQEQQAAKPESLAIAYSVSRQARKAQATRSAEPMDMEETEDRPNSIAEAILRKRKAAAAPVTAEEPAEDLDMSQESEISDISAEPVAEEPMDRISRIRAKLKGF